MLLQFFKSKLPDFPKNLPWGEQKNIAGVGDDKKNW